MFTDMMTGLEERSAFTWDSAAWIYSVIIAVVLVRYFMFVSNLLQEPRSAKLYYPYLAFMLANIIQLYTSWYLGKGTYMDIEGSPLLFASRSMSDVIMCIQGLMIVPKDNLLDDFFDMKSWFMKIKKTYLVVSILFFFGLMNHAILVSVYTDNWGTSQELVQAAIFSGIMILLNLISLVSKNDYYLSFHGTLVIVVWSSIFSQL